MRLIYSGLFDKFPRLQLILGHLGGILPFAAHRIDRYYGLGGEGCGGLEWIPPPGSPQRRGTNTFHHPERFVDNDGP